MNLNLRKVDDKSNKKGNLNQPSLMSSCSLELKELSDCNELSEENSMSSFDFIDLFFF